MQTRVWQCLIVLGLCFGSGYRFNDTFFAQEEAPFDIAYSGDGQYLAIVSPQGFVAIYDANGELLRTIVEEGVLTVAWDLIQPSIAIGGDDDFVRIYNVETGELVHQFPGIGYSTDNLDWHSGGDMLVLGTVDGFGIWDTDTWTRIYYGGGTFTDIDWSPNGDRLALAAAAGSIFIYDVNQESNALLTESLVLSGHPEGPPRLEIAWNPSGDRLVSGGGDGAVRLWNPQTGEMLTELLKVNQRVRDVIFIDDMTVAASTRRGKVYLIDINTADILAIYRLDILIERLAWNPVTHILIAGGSYYARNSNPLLDIRSIDLTDLIPNS